MSSSYVVSNDSCIEDTHIGVGRHTAVEPKVDVIRQYKVTYQPKTGLVWGYVRLIREFLGDLCRLTSICLRHHRHQNLYPSVLPTSILHTKFQNCNEDRRGFCYSLVDYCGLDPNLLLHSGSRILGHIYPFKMYRPRALLHCRRGTEHTY